MVAALTFKRHPLSAAFPDITGDAFKELKQDILMNGLQQSVVLYQDMILDGWNRYRACEELRQRPKFISFNGRDPVKFVISQNIHRRHLTVAERAQLATKLLAEEKKLAAIRQKELAGTRKTLASREAKVEQGKAAQKVAKAVGVSRASIERAIKIDKTAIPAVKKAVASGDIGLKEGERIAKLPKKQQAKALKTPTPKPRPTSKDAEVNAFKSVWRAASAEARREIVDWIKAQKI